jgi:hypothetical protein
LVASLFTHLVIASVYKDHPNRIGKTEDDEEQHPHCSRVCLVGIRLGCLVILLLHEDVHFFSENCPYFIAGAELLGIGRQLHIHST